LIALTLCGLRNLIRSHPRTAFKDIVLHGAVAPTGMERFDDLLSESDADNIHAYLIDESWKAYLAQQSQRTR